MADRLANVAAAPHNRPKIAVYNRLSMWSPRFHFHAPPLPNLFSTCANSSRLQTFATDVHGDVKGSTDAQSQTKFIEEIALNRTFALLDSICQCCVFTFVTS
ncbi:unnamed protein product [Heligmosomoides polygyrus]|uniref:Pentatricopeptide repeat-containing protein n=1 Tax=Heligmosomoides polygyrus TaxID=6339 RepID=A0A183FYD0_HELPZ|nr:unnamed protein product [Heligmosomoides polygyrus]